MTAPALLIDAMGTLVSLEDPVPRLIAGLRSRGVDGVTPARARAAMRAEIEHYRAHMMEGRDRPGVVALHAGCAAVLGDALGVALSPAAMTEVLLGSLRFVAFPDAVPALVRARRAGARVVVVSNWDASLPEALARAGLGPCLDGVVASAAVGVAKPDPAIFTEALRVAGVGARDCLHVGDSLIDDVGGARAAGIAAVLLRREGDDPDPLGVSVIRGLGELDGRLPSG